MKQKIVPGQKIICLNRKASFNYFFIEILEAGISLKGSEVKSLRDGKGGIADSYAIRREALQQKICYTTTIAGASALTQAIAQGQDHKVYRLQEMHQVVKH